MTANPLSNHIGPIINAITKNSGGRIKTKVDEIKSSMDEVYKVMLKIRAIPKKKFLMKNVVFAEKRVLITLLESVKNLKIYCKR